MLYEFRISKYDSRFRINEVYCKEDWTSIGDIGKKFGGKEFTYSEYEQTECRYLKLVEEICSELDVTQMKITDLEDRSGECDYQNGATLTSVKQITNLVKDCLREKYWCKLSTKNFYIHFGYDYYLYIGSCLNFQYMNNLVSKNGLFIEFITGRT